MEASAARVANTPDFFAQALVPVWLVITLVAVAIAGRNLGLPSPHTYMTGDEIVYGAVALEYAETGKYSARRVLPEGLWRTEERFALHPMLHTYLEALPLKRWGFTRPALRLPSLVLLAAGSFLLLHVCCVRNLPPMQSLGVLSAYVLSPWVIYAGTTARPEMLSGFLVLGSSWALLCSRQNPRRAWFASGALSAAAAYNHPIFIGLACLPFLLGFHFSAVDDTLSASRKTLWWLSGATLTGAGLVLVFIVPHWAAWQEQFFASAADLIVTQPDSPWTLLLEVRERFSTFGRLYLDWYALVPFFCLSLLRSTPLFWLGAGWLGGCTLLICALTPIHMHFLVQFAIGMPILVLLCKPRGGWFQRPGIVWAMAILILLLAVRTSWLVPRPTPASIAFRKLEEIIAPQIAMLPANQRIFGPLEAALPALKQGHRFFLDSPIFMEREAPFVARLLRRERASATHEVTPDGRLLRLSP